MGICLQCGTEIRIGGLCPAHAEAIATCDDVTAEQVLSGAVTEAASCLIDQWGNVHPLTERALVGRLQQECSVTILHHSVSAIHAQVELAGARGNAKEGEGGWRVVDRGSLNGTYVNDEAVRVAALSDGARVRFGNVSFYFSSHRLPVLQARFGAGYTVPVRQKDIAFHARVSDGAGKEMALAQRASGGIVRVDDETTVEFARLEFAFLKILAERRLASNDPELAFVSSKELSDLLEFKSADADGENVRELVRRVRRKFKSEGIPDLVESRQGVGYRLAWTVKP
ncbi:MAG TPA: FHA domain-containing protein [Kofleriaceae bacterium]|nr:FHA domain-containing protein [Kofleriaceae bacterium]